MDDITVDDYLIKGDRSYLKSHEWVKIFEDGTWLIGISDYAQKMLREISYVQFEDIGENFAKNDVICVVEALKATGDIYAPIDCELVENNSRLEDEPELVTQDPYEKGYLVKIRPKSNDQSELIKPQDYAKVIENELEDL